MVYGLTPYIEVARMKDRTILWNQTIQDKQIQKPAPPYYAQRDTMSLVIDIQSKFKYNRA